MHFVICVIRSPTFDQGKSVIWLKKVKEKEWIFIRFPTIVATEGATLFRHHCGKKLGSRKMNRNLSGELSITSLSLTLADWSNRA